MNINAAVDLKSIHETNKEIGKENSQHGEQFLYFLVICLHEDPEIDVDIALKIRAYDGLIGIDNSALDKYFRSFKILRLHAILHDATGFVYEYGEKGSRYPYVLSCSVTKEYRGHVTSVAFCLYVNQKLYIHLDGMLKSGAVVLVFEGFRSRKLGFTIKELAVSTKIYSGIISVLPPKLI